MGWKCGILAWSYTLLGLIVVGFVSSNIDQDRAECTDQVIGLATCLPYVGGEAKAPTPDCCSGLKIVLEKSKKCLCILIKDRNEPSLGINVNVTLALGLPSACHSPTNISQCIDLLHLSPKSKEAKDFLGFDGTANSKGNSSGSAAPATATVPDGENSKDDESGGGKRIRNLRFGLFETAMMTILFTSLLLILTHT